MKTISWEFIWHWTAHLEIGWSDDSGTVQIRISVIYLINLRIENGVYEFELWWFVSWNWFVIMVSEQEIPDERVPCQFCNRKFSPSSLLKHAVVCEKTSHKKRKTFDSAKQRIQGTELAEFLPAAVPKKNETSSNQQPKEKPIPVTRRVVDTTHNVPSRKHSSKVASPFTKSSNYERCPYCDRSFGPKAFDRHIEWCKEQSIRINSKSTATQEAKERLEARIKVCSSDIETCQNFWFMKFRWWPTVWCENRFSNALFLPQTMGLVRKFSDVWSRFLDTWIHCLV